MITIILVLVGIFLGLRLTKRNEYSSNQKILIIGGGALLGAFIGTIASTLISIIILVIAVLLIANTFKK